MTAPPRVRVATAEDGHVILHIDRDGFSPVHSPGQAPAEDADPLARHDPTSPASNAHVWQVQALAVHLD